MLGSRALWLFDAPVWARVKNVKVSELGTWSEHPVPYAPGPEVSSSVFLGASTSAWMVLQASDVLVAGLQKAVPGKRIVVLNFGDPRGNNPSNC